MNPIDDIDLAAAIAASMHFEGGSRSVTVDVSDGIVTLEGEVETTAQRDAAEAVVRKFDVAGIVNAITVSLPAH